MKELYSALNAATRIGRNWMIVFGLTMGGASDRFAQKSGNTLLLQWQPDTFLQLREDLRTSWSFVQGSSETMNWFGLPARSWLRGHASEVLLNLWKKERSPWMGHLDSQWRSWEVHKKLMLCIDAETLSMIGKAKLSAMKLWWTHWMWCHVNVKLTLELTTKDQARHKQCLRS